MSAVYLCVVCSAAPPCCLISDIWDRASEHLLSSVTVSLCMGSAGGYNFCLLRACIDVNVSWIADLCCVNSACNACQQRAMSIQSSAHTDFYLHPDNHQLEFHPRNSLYWKVKHQSQGRTLIPFIPIIYTNRFKDMRWNHTSWISWIACQIIHVSTCRYWHKMFYCTYISMLEFTPRVFIRAQTL